MQWLSIILSVVMMGTLIAIIYFASQAAIHAKDGKDKEAEKQARLAAIVAGVALALLLAFIVSIVIFERKTLKTSYAQHTQALNRAGQAYRTAYYGR